MKEADACLSCASVQSVSPGRTLIWRLLRTQYQYVEVAEIVF